MIQTRHSSPTRRKQGLLLPLAAAAAALCTTSLHATPYASGVTNSNGTIFFWLNEGGSTVTVKFDDGSLSTSFNGVSSGTNVASGQYSFALGSHTNYSISVYKVGAGVPTLIGSAAFTPRGVDVNKNPQSPYFGRVYGDASGAGGIYALNPDMSLSFGGVRSAGVAWLNNGFSPYRCFVAADDYLMVGDGSYGATSVSGVWRIDPNLTSAQLFLGPKGEAAGVAAGVFGSIQSRPVLIGNPTNGPVTLLQVDGDLPAANGYNSLLVYTNIMVYTNGSLALPWENPPDIVGPEIGLNLTADTLGGNEYPGLQYNPNNGLIYAGTYRENHSNPLLQIYSFDQASSTITPVWNSLYNGGTADYFLLTVGGLAHGTVDIAISPDGKYVSALSIDNWFVVCALTNGIPDVSTIFNNIPTSYTPNGRGLAFDAADNLYVSSSGIGAVQSWSLGITSTAVTTGGTQGATGFGVTYPSSTLNVTATTPVASQGGSNGSVGTPVPGVFTLYRTSPPTVAQTISFGLGGTATNGTYTVLPASVVAGAASNSIVLPPGVLSTNITIVPTTANVPRLQTTVVLTLLGGTTYSVVQPSSATVYIENTSGNQLVVTAGAPTMYKAFAADYASLSITRLGDTNAPAYTIPASAFTYAGAAVPGVDFTPFQSVTVNPGAVTVAPTISPLSNGVPPSDVVNAQYAGNKSVAVTLGAASGYTVATGAPVVLTLLDNAYPNATVLFADPLTDPNDAVNWGITYGTGDEQDQGANYDVEFGYDLTANNPESASNGLIGLPPDGSTNALRITCNKAFGTTYGGGVNVYYTNQAFGGNYAVRFNMNVVNGDGAYSVEGVSFGVNHNGTETNWWLGSGNPINGSGPWASDGVWYWIQSPPGGYGGFSYTEFEEYTGAGGTLPNTGWTELASVTAASLQNVFKPALFTATGGLQGGTPANNSPLSVSPADNTWSDVEIKQVKKVVTLTIDKTPIFVYTNTTTFTNGYLMLGYNCPIEGAYQQYVGTPDAAAYFSNLRVVALTPPAVITLADSYSGGNNSVTITFTSTDGDDSAGSFVLQSSGSNPVSGPYADVSGATITQVSTANGVATFQATTTSANSAQYYRIRHN